MTYETGRNLKKVTKMASEEKSKAILGNINCPVQIPLHMLYTTILFYLVQSVPRTLWTLMASLHQRFLSFVMSLSSA